jgi:hypothetical protein
MSTAQSPAGPATPSTSSTSLVSSTSSALHSNGTFVMPTASNGAMFMSSSGFAPPLLGASPHVRGRSRPDPPGHNSASSPRRGQPVRADIITTVGARPACLVNASANFVGETRAVYAFGGFDQYSDEIYNVSPIPELPRR